MGDGHRGFRASMPGRVAALALALSSACSAVFVNEPTEAMRTRRAPLTCTTSRAMPLADLVIGTTLASLVFATTYSAVEHFNDECSPGQCYRPWGPALIGAFLVGSPFWINSIVGFSDTGECRELVRVQTTTRPMGIAPEPAAPQSRR